MKWIKMEVIVKKMDGQGRVSIPIRWRSSWRSRKLILIRYGNQVKMVPIEPVPPSNLFDSIEVSSEVDFSDPHSLKRALLEIRGS
ncbi:MAG: hypothetical protein QW238_01955 [Candidatus Bathyarchaeia archaeon]